MTETLPQTLNELPGVNVALMGPSGTGKTHAIGTLVDTGLNVRYLALEPGLESLLGYWRDRGKPVPDNLAWHFPPVAAQGFGDMIKSAKQINTLAPDALAKISDPHKTKYDRFIKILEALANFKDDRTGQEFGSVDEWDNRTVLVIDGLTGLSTASMNMMIGGKPMKSQAEWGIAQDQVERLLRYLCDNCNCWFVLLAHVEREPDPISGVKITVSTLGQKLAPKIPSMFSDVILTVREGSNFSWDTAAAQADTKTRNLPIKAGQTPDFAAILKKWEARQS